MTSNPNLATFSIKTDLEENMLALCNLQLVHKAASSVQFTLNCKDEQ